MVRYFDLYEQKITARLTIKNHSNAATAPIEEFEKMFRAKDREIDESQYDILTEAYTSEVQNVGN